MCIDQNWQTQLQNLTDNMERSRAIAERITTKDNGYIVAQSIHTKHCNELLTYVAEQFGTPVYFVNFMKRELRDATPKEFNADNFLDRYKWNLRTSVGPVAQARSISMVFRHAFLPAQKQIAHALELGVFKSDALLLTA